MYARGTLASGKVGQIFREIQFELSEGTPRSPYARFFVEHRELLVRAQAMHSTNEQMWELVDARGPAADLGALRVFLDEGPVAPAEDVEVLHDGEGRVQFLVRWRRPRPGEPAVSLEYLAQQEVGPDAIVATLFEGGRIEVRVAGSDGERLLRFFREVEAALGDRFCVRMLRIGEMRPDWSPVPQVKRQEVASEDRKLVAYALGAGYYDSPKRIGVRELGEALGWSKSVVARRLREVERRALETLLCAPGGAPPEAATITASSGAMPPATGPAAAPDALESTTWPAGEV